MTDLKRHFVVDEKDKRIGSVLDIKDYEKLLEEHEEPASIRATSQTPWHCTYKTKLLNYHRKHPQYIVRISTLYDRMTVRQVFIRQTAVYFHFFDPWDREHLDDFRVFFHRVLSRALISIVGSHNHR